MPSSRRKRIANRAKFQTELVVSHNCIHAVPCGTADSALSCPDLACTAPGAPYRRKNTCVVQREVANAPRTSVVPVRLESAAASLSAFLSASNKSDDASLRIAEGYAHRGLRTKSRQCLCLPWPPLSLRCIGHANTMPDASTLRNARATSSHVPTFD